MDSLFVNLRKYRPRENTDPLENFVTEAFAWLLRRNTELNQCFVEKIANTLAETNKAFTPPSEDISWSTQENYNGFFPDMEAKWPGMTLVFEHKVWSPLHPNQLQRYRDYHESKNEYRMILITGTRSQHDQNPDLALCWQDIYEWIDDFLTDNALGDMEWVVRDFLKLLKAEGLGPPAPISHNAIWHYQEAAKLPGRLGHLISRVAAHSWPVKAGYKSHIRNKEGLIGIQFSRVSLESPGSSWTPGIFIGFILDGSDHCVWPRMKDGLNMCLKISFSQKYHNVYPKMPEYQQLVRELAEKAKKSSHSWTHYHHYEEAEAKSRNDWHPLYLEYSMLELFKGTAKAEEQEQRFIGKAEEALAMLLSCPAFEQLEEALLLTPEVRGQ